MIYLDYETYCDKVKACFIGKNIGGTIGTPYEGKRELLDVKGFTTPPGEPLPNDDLDLQLVWLHALECVGVQGINAATLGEFWLSYITPYWNEYGISKTNMMRGIAPPASGDFENNWCNSNGAWIRTEVWATTAPGVPELSAKLAMEDAKVDHGAGEGTMAAAFVAAMQSAAFVLTTLRECIEVGLAAVPDTSRTAQSVRLVLECYDSGKDWKEARNAVLNQNADIGNGWFEAPSNVAYAVLGLVYGEGDFKKSMLTAVNCGDDTDCTAATAGATMGILYGMKGVPEDWAQYIGDKIITISIARGGNGRSVPATCTELTERIVAMAPAVLQAYSGRFDHRQYEKCTVRFGKEEIPENVLDFFKRRVVAKVRPELASLKPNSLQFNAAFMDVTVSLSTLKIAPCGEAVATVTVKNNAVYDNVQHTIALRWLLPEGFTAEGEKNVFLYSYDAHKNGTAEITYVLKAGEHVDATNRLVLEITSPGRHTALYAPVVLVG